MRKRKMIMCLVVVMMLSILPSEAYAAKKVKLSSKKLSLKVGQKKTLKLKNNKKKVKWSVVSGKKFVKLSAKKKTGVTIKGKKKGTAKVQAKIGKKKYTCKVVVKQPRKKSVKRSAKPTRLPTTKKPTNTPSTQSKKKVASISYSGNKYVFLEKGKRLVDKGNTNLEDGEEDIGSLKTEVNVKYTDGIEEKADWENVSLDFSQINYEKIGVYDIILTYEGCTCKVPVVIAERKTEGLYTYLTDGTVAELETVVGDKKVIDEEKDAGYYYEFSSATLTIPETLGGAKVVQGIPYCGEDTSFKNIEKIVIPKFYSENYEALAYYLSGYYDSQDFLKLKEFVVDEGNDCFTAKGNVLFSKDGTVLCVYPAGLTAASYQIPEGVMWGNGVESIICNPYLTELTFPKTYVDMQREGVVDNVSGITCGYLPNLKKINVAGDNPYWCSIDGVLYAKEANNKLSLIAYPAQKKDKSFTVGENVTSFANGGLYNEYLENITFKSWETDIGNWLSARYIKNIYLDFNFPDRYDNRNLYLNEYYFTKDDDDSLNFNFNIYIRNEEALACMTEFLQSKVVYY